MAKTRKTWREKLEKDQGLPKVVNGPGGRGRMLVPKPLDIDGLIRKIPKGKLAKDFHVDFTCPLTTGIFLRIAAEAAEEDLRGGKEQVTPYWRVVKADGNLNEKFPGATEAQAARLRGEGHGIELGQGRKPPRVKDFEKSLYMKNN